MDGLDLYLIGTFLTSIIFWIPIFSISFLPESSSYKMLVLLLASLFGFSFFNYPKAKLFMGDSGSLALGFLIFFLPCFAIGQAKEQMELLDLFFLFPIFWIDGVITIIMRSFQRKNIFSAHKEHLYQKLAETKLGKSGASFLMIFLNLPALVSFVLFKLNLIHLKISNQNFTLMIILIYISIYLIIRFVFFGSRKNLA
jgi:UDP-N-acetylmuramyl pentapeptide phosphotransferase/UDP-N-acetylglucosamine-1-phosphate transferase